MQPTQKAPAPGFETVICRNVCSVQTSSAWRKKKETTVEELNKISEQQNMQQQQQQHKTTQQHATTQVGSFVLVSNNQSSIELNC